MKCTFPGCSVCAILTILNAKSDRLDIPFSCSLRHKGNIHHGRRVKGIERENFKKELSGAHPSRLHHRLLASLPEKVYASGNRDGVGTQHTLQKISSEKNCAQLFIWRIASIDRGTWNYRRAKQFCTSKSFLDMYVPRTVCYP